MSLYALLAPVYDRLFPVHPEALPFLEKAARLGLAARGRLEAPHRAFDAGSATGGHVLALAARGWEADGIEPEPSMTEAARARAAALGLKSARFFEGDMRDALRLLGAGAEGSYTLGLCLGNTLPHLPDRDSLDLFLGASRRLLGDGGALALQLLNYGRPEAGPGFAFPELRAEALVMKRRYEAGPQGKLRFVVELDIDGKAAGSEEALLTPLSPAALGAALSRGGFAELELFGAWSGAPFDEGRDPYLLAVARARS
ncbi:MAG: class I SAM-dependent methyltransferase [Spirochaetaceae bacterium]|nr:class I SAM-dependent methyltransferase [Spirochaetaceae bacterium]